MPPKHRGWNRQNMIKDLRERTGFKKGVVEKVLDTFIDLMDENLKGVNTIYFNNMFMVHIEQSERKVYEQGEAYKEDVVVPPKYVIRFEVATKLKKRLREQSLEDFKDEYEFFYSEREKHRRTKQERWQWFKAQKAKYNRAYYEQKRKERQSYWDNKKNVQSDTRADD